MREIFDAALRRKPDDRKAYLDEACRDDGFLRGEVESLLSSFDEAESFLEKPAVGEVAELILEESNNLAKGTTFSHYKIISQIGVGGMGEVYLAEDTLLKRQVAVKFLKHISDKNSDHLSRFFQEARAASALNHPNILTIHEIGDVDDTSFIAAEFVNGKTLREHFKHEKISLSEILDIVIQIANALSAAHSAGIVHRDIKPENIMLREDGLVKVLDFGLAKLTQEKTKEADKEASTRPQVNTQAGMILGTVAYMSPEQARGRSVDARTDVWSLGVVLYEMLTGKQPFRGETSSDVIASILKTQPAPLTKFNAEIPAELNRIVLKTLQKDRDESYQVVKDLLIDLKHLKKHLEFEAERTASVNQSETKINNTPTTAETHTVSSAEYLVSEIKQHKRGFVAVLAVLLVAAIGLGYWFFANRSANRTPIESIAVLPLKSLDADENYLGLGIADAVIRRLSQTGELTVRPTSAVRRYLTEEKDALTAARELNADAVLEGSVQRNGDRLRVSVNLLRTSDAVSLWADSFDMRMTDIFTIQDTVAQQVAARLRLQLDPAQQARFNKRSTSNAIAYEFYVKGVYSFEQRGYGDFAKPQMEATIALFKKAIEADPDYALAHAQLANAYIWKALFIEEQAFWADMAKEEINRADALDPQLAETHIARHWLLVSAYEGWQSEAAVRELLLAQQLNPNVGHVELGGIYYHLGLEDLGDRAYQRALDIDPTSEFVKKMIYAHYSLLRKYDEAYAAYQKYQPSAPTPFWYLMGKGRLDEAQKRLDDSSVKYPNNPGLEIQKALLFALKGNFRAAETEIPSILSKINPQDYSYHHDTYDIACVYALTGKSDEAIKLLRETAAKGFPSYPLFERDAYLNRIRQTPEFIRFIEEMKAQNERYKSEFE